MKTTVGYTGGRNQLPNYDSVCFGDGHTESLRVEYDPSEVTYEKLLDQFWSAHDPEPALPQYKSAIWFHDEEQRVAAETAVASKGTPHTQVVPARKWYDAEEHHQKFYEKQQPAQQKKAQERQGFDPRRLTKSES